MSRLHYCTWAKSPNSPELGVFLESSRRQGIEVDVMLANGFLEKPVALRKHISSLPDSDIVLCTDGYDVVYTPSEKTIRSRFEKFNAPVVFSGEKGCYHHFAESKEYFERTGGSGLYPYLNSGLMIGYVGAVRMMLNDKIWFEEDLKESFRKAVGIVGFFNDQSIYGRYACQNSGKVAVDTNADLFWTLSDEKYDIDRHADIHPGGVFNLTSRTLPCLVHVSHKRKFYLVYLYVAWKMGIELKGSDLDINLLKKLLEEKAGTRKKDTIVIDAEFKKVLMDVSPLRSGQKQTCGSIAIIFIGTGNYIKYFKNYYETNKKNFLPNTPKTYFVFTDDVGCDDLYGRNDIVTLETTAEKWPYSTLFRFQYINRISKQLASFSHTIYADADMFFFSEVSEEEFFSHDKALFGVQHPGNFLYGQAPYELNPESSASVSKQDDASMYWQGCLWGGRTQDVLTLSRILAERIEDDLSKDIIARWHDESHLNKYFLENRPDVHTLPPGYAYPETLEGKLHVEKKIVHLSKNHKKMRNSQATTTVEEKNPNPGLHIPGFGVNDSTVLVPVSGYYLEDTECSLVVKNRIEQTVAELNESSAQIWRLCHGGIRVRDLVEILSARYSVSHEILRQDVYTTLNTLVGIGVIYVKGAMSQVDAVQNKPGVHFFSFANNVKAKQLATLDESSRTHGLSIRLLGGGLKNFTTATKLDLLYEELCKLGDDEIVCAVDGYDVFFCAQEDEIKERFLSFNCDCVVSAERAYAHQYKKYKQHYDRTHTKSPYRYVNTGSVMGYAGALRKIYTPTLSTRYQPRIFTPRKINQIKKWSNNVAQKLGFKNFDSNFVYSHIYYTDQQHIGKYVARNPGNLNIVLDYDTRLFWCCAWEWEDIHNHFRIEGHRIVNNHTNSAPVAIHVPGWRAHRRVLRELFNIQQSLSQSSHR